MTDLFDLLTPEVVDTASLERAVDMARALASAEHSRACELTPGEVEREYQDQVRRAGVAMCGRLFRMHLASLNGRSGLEAWAFERGDSGRVWVALLELEGRGMDLALPSLPAPGEPAGLVAARLLAAAECLGLGPGLGSLWRAHLTAAEAGPVSGGKAYLGVLEASELDFGERVQAHLGYLGCLLQRGSVARAQEWVQGHMDVVAASKEMLRIAGWVALAAGDREAAAEYVVPMPRAGCPGPVVALGDRVPELRDLIGGGSEWNPEEAGGGSPWTGLRRSDIGAAALCMIELGPDGLRVAHGEFAPGLVGPDRAWLERQQAAPYEPGEPEFGLMQGGGVFVGFPDGTGDTELRRLARGCISKRCLGLALMPLYDSEGGALRGWLRLEFEHLFVPEAQRLLRFAAAVGKRIGLGVARRVVDPGLALEADRLLGKAVKGVSMGRRRWWCLSRIGKGLEVLASAGTALDDWRHRGGSRDAIMRCLDEARPLCLGDLGEGMHGGARSGFVLPLGGALKARFALVFESNRASDLGPKEMNELLTGTRGDVRGLGALLESAAFEQHECLQFGTELTLGIEAPEAAPRALGLTVAIGVSGWMEALGALGAGVMLVQGPRGCGKRTLGRMRAFLEEEVAVERQARCLDEPGLELVLAQGAAVLVDVEELAPGLQPVLFEAIQTGRADGLVCTSSCEQGTLGLWGRLAEALEARTVALAGLAQRRNELPTIVRVGLRRAARAQSCVAPVLTDGAIDLIWRQDWRGGIHEVLDFARRVVPLTHGREVSMEELAALASELGLDVKRKLPTKDIDCSALWQALDGTRKKGGGFHRGRAAGRLGWDPDTLGLRMGELGL